MLKAIEYFRAAFLKAAGTGGGNIHIPSFAGCSDAFAAEALSSTGAKHEGKNVVLALTPGIAEAERLAYDISILSRVSDFKLLEFPCDDADGGSFGERARTVAALDAWPLSPCRCIIVAPAEAAKEDIAAIDVKSRFTASIGRTAFTELKNALADFGYERVFAVYEPGQWAVRGGILDVWPIGDDMPVRFEFFGEEIENCRFFAPDTQRSADDTDNIVILSRKKNGGGSSAKKTLFDFLPEDAVILALGHGGYELGETGFFTVYSGLPVPEKTRAADFSASPLPGFSELGLSHIRHPELFDAARQKLERHLEASEKRGFLICRKDDFSRGFEIDGLDVVAKSDRVFAKIPERRKRAGVHGGRISAFEELEPGELVVHVNHGIGKYIGSSEINISGKMCEMFTVEYSGGAKLHIPSTHAHLLSRYIGIGGGDVELHSLDGKRWSKDRMNAEKAVQDLAASLLRSQAARETAEGFRYETECEGLDAFEAAFPYTETEDQTAAVKDIKKDMASDRPMDRLVCGDAGYGKTEVAARAAFIAAMNGKQTVVLAPTTVLAEQHFETFTSRFDGTPIRIECLSRFKTAAAKEGTLARLESGACDILVGTHAVLSKRVKFRNLGLVVIDEEQRFGVRHKEQLRSFSADIDILTLSATPIPRTLYFSMIGTRDFSLLRTPPRERQGVETVVARDNDETVRRAIERELASGGQVFYLHNRVSTIGEAEKRVNALVPGAKTVVAHGKMDAADLAKRTKAFERGEYDILVSTTIVESGIDIPRANTIIIDRADMFGLADLYQLRGRVGRSSKRAYAILLLPPSGMLERDVTERLEVLKRSSLPGAGFNVALRDLEFRGAGNLLGPQQSGHASAIGFTLYCQLLKKTIAEIKGEKTEEPACATLNFDFTSSSYGDDRDGTGARIPYFYIEEDSHRMSVLRKLAEVSSMKDLGKIKDELTDRFGPPPPPVRRLLNTAKIRISCSRKGIGRIDAAGGKIVLRLSDDSVVKVADLKGDTEDAKLESVEKAVEEYEPVK